MRKGNINDFIRNYSNKKKDVYKLIDKILNKHLPLEFKKKSITVDYSENITFNPQNLMELRIHQEHDKSNQLEKNN